jgi:ferredoxin
LGSPNGVLSGGSGNGNFVAASTDAVAIDCVVAKLLSKDPDRILTTRLAAEAGLGIGWMEAIRLVGEELDEVKSSLAGKIQLKSSGIWPRVLMALVEPLSWVRSQVNSQTCDGCGKCTEVCPTKAMQFDNGSRTPSINYKLCIGCWAGLSNCPNEAIELRKSRLSDKVFSS